jgi:hypothetical protein
MPERYAKQKRIITLDDKILGMATANSNNSSEDSIVTVVNPEEDDITVELEFYDETMEGVEGVSMPEPSE